MPCDWLPKAYDETDHPTVKTAASEKPPMSRKVTHVTWYGYTLTIRTFLLSENNLELDLPWNETTIIRLSACIKVHSLKQQQTETLRFPSVYCIIQLGWA